MAQTGISDRMRSSLVCAVIAIGSVSVGLTNAREGLLGVASEAKDLAASEMEQVRAFARQDIMANTSRLTKATALSSS